MAADHGDELGGGSGDGPRIEHGIGPVGSAAVKLLLVGAIGVHVEEDARDKVRNIRVFPAQIEQTPVVQNRGTPVVVLVEGQAADHPGPAF